MHEGVDIIATGGTPVYAVADGIISKIYVDQPGSRSGNGLRLRTSDGSYFFYAHFQQFAPSATLNARVKAGDVLGYVGRTGNTQVNHLHFEIHPGGGSPINPTALVRAIGTCKQPATSVQASAVPVPGATGTTPLTAAPASASASTVPAAPVVASSAPSAPATPPASATTPIATTPARSTPRGLKAVGPIRVADSRFGTAKRLAPGVITQISVARGGVPNTASAAQLTVWSTGSAAGGYLSVFPCVATTPGTSTVNFSAGQTIAAAVFVGLSSAKFCATASVPTDVIVDVNGYADGQGTLGVIATNPFRAFDSAWHGQRLLAGTERAVRVVGATGMPTAASAVSVTVTTSGSTTRSSILAYPCGTTPSGVPVIVGGIGQTNAATFTIGVGANGALCLRSTADINAIVDVHTAWAASGAQMSAALPWRTLDTRATGRPQPGVPNELVIAGVGQVPGGASAVAITATVTASSVPVQLTVWPCFTTKPNTVLVSVSANSTVAGGAVVGLGAGKLCWSTAGGGANVIFDVTGFAK